MEKTTLYLDPALHRRIRELSRRHDRPQSELIREALERYVQGEAPPAPRSIGAGADGEIGARESEAWLKAQWSQRGDRADR